jgi:hypothetical protein
MTIRLEHANTSVRDINGMIRFLRTAFLELRVRREDVLSPTMTPNNLVSYPSRPPSVCVHSAHAVPA